VAGLDMDRDSLTSCLSVGGKRAFDAACYAEYDFNVRLAFHYHRSVHFFNAKHWRIKETVAAWERLPFLGKQKSVRFAVIPVRVGSRQARPATIPPQHLYPLETQRKID
jgi:hypothetical protein